MAGDRDHRWADRMVARMQCWIFLTALAVALMTWLFGDAEHGRSSASTETVSIPAMPWRSHPPIEVYR